MLMAQNTVVKPADLRLHESSQIKVELLDAESQQRLKAIISHCEILIRSGSASFEDYETYVACQLKLAKQETVS